jgi:hypothetical protein
MFRSAQHDNSSIFARGLLKTLRVEVNDGQRRWQPRSPAMAAGLSDRLWSAEELLTKVVAPSSINT